MLKYSPPSSNRLPLNNRPLLVQSLPLAIIRGNTVYGKVLSIHSFSFYGPHILGRER